ncbi:hypothetical protein BKA64DRAFT_715299 [Cadophora sp. MPI-SDFR-AT-0126]|nr:hypothetical protein BKA64DRAFT_715299 [Leotiomycetes sp. MPI-SDFR-AT-0126]
MPSSLKKLYDHHNSKFPPSVPSDDELKNTLLALIDEPMQVLSPPSKDRRLHLEPKYLLIDALDELPLGSNRDHIIKYLDELAAMCTPNLHILATSRNESDIRAGLQSWQTTLVIDKKKVAEDMRLYVTSEINKHEEMFRQKDAIKHLILRRLVEEGNGMFRWAALQLEELKALRPMKPRSIKQALQSLPGDLDDTYERILTKIPAGNTKEALSILRWISFATRPLYVEEIMDVCGIRLNEEPEFDIEERYHPRDILDVLPGLITINPPLKSAETPIYGLHTVAFSHFSVQEYLTGSRIISSAARGYALEAEYSNHYIARSSIAYLSCVNLFGLREEDFPLRGYAWDHWAWHASYRGDKDTEELAYDTETLSTSITQSNMQGYGAALQHLKGRLSYVAPWHPSTAQRSREQDHALRLPFFFPEFDSEIWKKHYNLNYQSLPEYKFRPARSENAEIRLMELFPSSKRYGEVRCRIFHVLLDSKPAYDGVSYARRPNDGIGCIRANGLLLQFPRALVQDLRNLREKTGSQGRVLFLWDIHWDNSPYLVKWQLRLNARIFKQAQQVAIGLGDQSERDHGAIEFVRAIDSMFTSRVDTSGSSTTIAARNHESFSDGIGVAILQLFQRPWWRRMWPVQELMLPRKATLYYGDEAITFDSFQKLFSSQQTIKSLIGNEDYSALVSDRAWIGAQRISLLRARYLLGHHPTLPELLWATEFHLAKDRIDKVYALFGLLEPEEQDSAYLAHDKTKSDEENFINVAIHITNRYRNLDILSYACHHRPLEPLLPSWAPDFSVAGDDVRPLVEGTFGPPRSANLFNAAGNKSYHSILARDSRILTAEGSSFDHVGKLFRAFNPSESRVSLLDLYSSIKEEMRSDLTLETFWRTVQADQKGGHRLGKMNHDSTKSDPSQDEYPDLGLCKGRRLVLTSMGYLCLAPVQSEVGDKIVVLVGGKVPYMLRKTGEGFEIVGECYVYGIMDGAIMGAFPAEKGAGESFRIC